LPRASSCRFSAHEHYSTLLPILASAASQLQPPTSASAFFSARPAGFAPRHRTWSSPERVSQLHGPSLRSHTAISHWQRPSSLTLNEFPPAERKVGAGTRPQGPSAVPQSTGQVHEPPPPGCSQRVWRVRRSGTAPRRSQGPPAVEP